MVHISFKYEISVFIGNGKFWNFVGENELWIYDWRKKKISELAPPLTHLAF